MTKHASEFHAGDHAPTGYGDVSGVGTGDDETGGPTGGGERPMDESAYDEDPAADAAVGSDAAPTLDAAEDDPTTAPAVTAGPAGPAGA